MGKTPISKYLAKIGKKGGTVKGKTKARGDSDYYRKLAAKRQYGKFKRGIGA